MTLTITAEQRDALYEETVVRLSGIDAIFFAVKADDFDASTPPRASDASTPMSCSWSLTTSASDRERARRLS